MSKPIIISAACVAALFATVAMGQTEIPSGDKAVTKWMSDNKVRQDANGEDWRRVAADDQGIHMRRVRLETPERAPNAKTKTLVMRLELFKPMQDASGKVSSIAFDYDLDCQNNRFKQVVINAYPEYNLTGRPRTERVDGDEWAPTKADPMMNAVADVVCQDISGNAGGQLYKRGGGR